MLGRCTGPRCWPSATRGLSVLLTIFSKSLANVLKVKLGYLLGNELAVAGQIDVRPVAGIGYDLFAVAFGQSNIAPGALVRTLLASRPRASVEGHGFTPQFLWGEWADVVDAWQLGTWEACHDVAGLGRRTRVGGKQGEALWAIFAAVRAELAKRKAVTWAELLGRVTYRIQQTGRSPFPFVVEDEAQEVPPSPSCASRPYSAAVAPDGLFFTDDLGQRILQEPLLWKAPGRRRARALAYAEGQLPHLAPDARRPTGCCPRLCAMSTALRRPGAGRSPFRRAGAGGGDLRRQAGETAKVALDRASGRRWDEPQAIGVFVRSRRELNAPAPPSPPRRSLLVELCDKAHGPRSAASLSA